MQEPRPVHDERSAFLSRQSARTNKDRVVVFARKMIGDNFRSRIIFLDKREYSNERSNTIKYFWKILLCRYVCKKFISVKLCDQNCILTQFFIVYNKSRTYIAFVIVALLYNASYILGSFWRIEYLGAPFSEAGESLSFRIYLRRVTPRETLFRAYAAPAPLFPKAMRPRRQQDYLKSTWEFSRRHVSMWSPTGEPHSFVCRTSALLAGISGFMLSSFGLCPACYTPGTYLLLLCRYHLQVNNVETHSRNRRANADPKKPTRKISVESNLSTYFFTDFVPDRTKIARTRSRFKFRSGK